MFQSKSNAGPAQCLFAALLLTATCSLASANHILALHKQTGDVNRPQQSRENIQVAQIDRKPPPPQQRSTRSQRPYIGGYTPPKPQRPSGSSLPKPPPPPGVFILPELPQPTPENYRGWP